MSAPAPTLAEHHRFNALGKDILLDVRSMLFYEVNGVVADLVALLETRSFPRAVRVARWRHGRGIVAEALAMLRREGLLHEPGDGIPPPENSLRRARSIRHLELMVTNGCNLACRYCYGGDAAWESAPALYGGAREPMTPDVARKGIDLLLRECGANRRLSVIFFGGEPLLNFSTIKEAVAYARARERESGRQLDLSLVTNGTLLSDEVIDFVCRHRVGVQVSIDGPKALQDHNRPLRGGQGSFDRLLPGVQRLIARRPGRVPARVTVSRGHVQLRAVVNYLLALGFGSVHVEPAAGDSGPVAVTQADVEEMLRQNRELAALLIERVRAGERFHYSNLVRHVRATHAVDERRFYYCGAARSYLTVATDGALYPCHRFAGLPEFVMGHVDAWLDRTWQRRLLAFDVDSRPGCRDCWARYFCGGGCWKTNHDATGRVEEPDNDVGCRLTRQQIELAMAVNTELGGHACEVLADDAAASTVGSIG